MTEWRPVVNFEGLYEVSDAGDVYSLRRSTILALHQSAKGYLNAKLVAKDRKKMTVYVHRLVLTAFVGPCPEGMAGLHENGNIVDNRLSNLRWAVPPQSPLWEELPEEKRTELLDRWKGLLLRESNPDQNRTSS